MSDMFNNNNFHSYNMLKITNRNIESVINIESRHSHTHLDYIF